MGALPRGSVDAKAQSRGVRESIDKEVDEADLRNFAPCFASTPTP